jgi:hypothetical protein
MRLGRGWAHYLYRLRPCVCATSGTAGKAHTQEEAHLQEIHPVRVCIHVCVSVCVCVCVCMCVYTPVCMLCMCVCVFVRVLMRAIYAVCS